MKWLIAALQPVALQLAGVLVQLLAAQATRALEQRAEPLRDDQPDLPLGR